MDTLTKLVLLITVLFAIALSSSNAQTQAQKPCSTYNGTSCKQCTDGNDRCFWCDSDKVCREWKWGKDHLLPTGTNCRGYNWNYKSCTLNGVAYAVIISVVVFVVIVLITCCVVCCCVCCARRNKRTWRKHQEKYEDERREIGERSAQRRAERKTRTDEIRRKYGLDKNEHDSKYEKFV